jgi:ribosomal protein S18 acetylase RimI-like enzyme
VTDAYRLVPAPPSAEDYLALRRDAGLSPKTEDQARAGVAGAWAACHVVHAPTGRAVAMGRVIGDGGWYFHIIDMATLPDHQRRGLGAMVLDHLLAEIRQRAPAGAWVNLLADPPGRKLYASRGFAETAPGSIGMALHL